MTLDIETVQLNVDDKKHATFATEVREYHNPGIREFQLSFFYAPEDFPLRFERFYVVEETSNSWHRFRDENVADEILSILTKRPRCAWKTNFAENLSRTPQKKTWNHCANWLRRQTQTKLLCTVLELQYQP